MVQYPSMSGSADIFSMLLQAGGGRKQEKPVLFFLQSGGAGTLYVLFFPADYYEDWILSECDADSFYSGSACQD